MNNSTAASRLMIKSQLFDKAKELIKKESRIEFNSFFQGFYNDFQDILYIIYIQLLKLILFFVFLFIKLKNKKTKALLHHHNNQPPNEVEINHDVNTAAIEFINEKKYKLSNIVYVDKSDITTERKYCNCNGNCSKLTCWCKKKNEICTDKCHTKSISNNICVNVF